MKLIQILFLAAAVTVSAAAQNATSTSQNTGSSAQPAGTPKSSSAAATESSKTSPGSKSSPKGGSSTQPAGVKLIVPKTSGQTNTAGAKNSSATSGSKSGAQAAPVKIPAANNSVKTPVVSSKATAQKTPVLTVKPAQKPATNAKTASSATAKTTAKKSTAGKAVSTPKKNQVKIVPQKTAGAKKPVNNAATTTVTASGRRDPFMSIIRNMPSTPAGPNCSVGKRCLFIPELELKGIAKDPDGQMLAVVVSNTHRAYFLRENDQVFNGSVQKITSDSVVFREFATDHLGRETAHEVVKKIPKS